MKLARNVIRGSLLLNVVDVGKRAVVHELGARVNWLEALCGFAQLDAQRSFSKFSTSRAILLSRPLVGQFSC